MKCSFFCFIIVNLFSLSDLSSQQLFEWNIENNKRFEITQDSSNIINVLGADTINFKLLDGALEVIAISNDTIKIVNDSISLKGRAYKILFELDEFLIRAKNHKTLTLSFKKEKEQGLGVKVRDSNNVYYDALILSKFIDSNNVVLRILTKYKVTSLNNFFKSVGIKKVGGLASKSLISSPLSSILGLDVTTLADGLAKFLVARVKKEMAIAIFDDLSKRIRSDSTKDVQTLFKNTYEILDLLGDKIYDFQPYVSSLRQNMEYDFQNMPQSFQSLLENDESHIHQLLSTQRNLLYLTGNSLDLGMEIKENVHLGKALGLHDFNKYHENGDTSLIGTLKTLQLFSESLRDTFTADTMPYWIDKSKINKLLNEPVLLKCFVGLLAEIAKSDNIMLSPKTKLYEYLNDSIGPNGINKFNTFIKSLQTNITQIQLIHTKSRISSTDDDKKLNVVNYFDAATGLLESSKHLIKLFKKVENPNQIDTFFSIASNINGIIKYAVSKKYTLSAMHLAKIFGHFKSSNQATFKTISFIIDKAMIVGQLAEAQTADEVKEVIESFAAPVGSWRDKRMAKMNIALDSYVGPGYIQSISKKNTAVADVSHFTVSTPVGISTTFMLSKGKTPFTLMLSAIDIGPLAAKRFADDTASIGKIYLKEILAPGIHASIGIGKKTPISVNVGYQQFPLLKKIGEVDLFHKTGLSASINVNIPILTLKNEKISKVTRS